MHVNRFEEFRKKIECELEDPRTFEQVLSQLHRLEKDQPDLFVCQQSQDPL
jgi:hypothetical protein